ncbi:proton channel OTOP3-like [Bufo bufo]|uniref:proton channel OTOP3-like n=1 Tax=Bufo bufo TaxID=8384 RepID=UPI001ABDA64B|nr:proton channel OTOP3-like [Bufo bufo]
MPLGEPNQPITHEGFSISYEHSWLHRHCPSTLIHHKRARVSGRLFSGLLAMNVVFLGAALISSVVISSMPAENSYIYLSVLMLFSSAWAIYYLAWTRRKTKAVLQDHHAGALWLKASLILFGTCSLLVAVFKICYDSSLFSCKLPIDIVFSVIKIIFTIIQMLLLWVCCRDCVQVQHNISRWGIMLTLATHLLLWLLAVINDSVHQDMESLHSNTTSDEVEGTGCLCPKYSTCWTFQRGYVTLYPFNLEYSLICASMLFIMWRNVGRREVHHSGSSHPAFRLHGVLYGPLLGVSALLVGICIFIQYQVQASGGVVVTASFILYFMYSIILLSIMVIACIIGIIAQTFRDKRHMAHTRQDNENSETPEKLRKEKRQKKSKECRHRNVENKHHGQSEGEVEESRQSKEVENSNVEFQEHIGCSTTAEEENCEHDEKQAKNETHNGDTEMHDLHKEHEEHLDLNNHPTKRKVSTEINTHQREKNIHHRSLPKNYTRSLEIILLLGASLGQFSISYYSIVAIVATGSWNLLNSLNLSSSILMILQHMFQNIFIIEGMRKEHKEHYYLQAQKENKEEHEEAPRRLSMVEIRRASVAYLQSVGQLSVSRRLVKEVALFLVLCNVMFWIMSAFGGHPQYVNGLELEYYGFSVWFAILNIGLPLSVFYRMHSVGGLLEVYVTA